MSDLRDLVVVVTGGGTGVGQGLCYEAARRGARVVVASPDPADDTIARIIGQGGDARWIETDVSSYEQVRALADSVAKHMGGVNVLINNAAGGGSAGRLAESDPEKVRRTFEINILGVFNGIHAFSPLLRAAADRGEFAHVITVGSEHSFGVPTTAPPNSAYTISKYAGLGFTDTCRRDFEGTGVGTSLLAPSWVLTAAVEEYRDNASEEVRALIGDKPQSTEFVARAAFDGALAGRHLIPTNPVSADFAKQFSLERLAAFEELVQ